jgi:putative peptidoglycan lipid II flippase
MIKGFRQIAFLTTLSRIFGMLRDMAFAYFLGASALMDGWVIAFMIPNLARRLFGEGAASSSLIPVYSEQLQKDPEQAKKLASTVVTVIFLILVAIVLAGEAIIWGYYRFFSVYAGTRLKLVLSAIMLPYMILICIVAILGGILNAHRHFAFPAAAPLVLNIFIIGLLCFSGWFLAIQPKGQVFIIAVTVLVAGLAQLAMQIPPLRASGVSIRPAWEIDSEPFKKILALMGPMILGLSATQINTLADHFTALWLSGSQEKGQFFHFLGMQLRYPMWAGSVSQLFYSQRLYQFPLGVLGISLATAIFPVMSSSAASKDFAALCRTVSEGLKSAVFVALPATVGLIVVGRPLVSAIFEHGHFTAADTALTTRVLWFYALGLCGFFCQQLVTRAFYSMQDSRMPAVTAVAAVLVNIILNLTFVWFMATAGLALSTAVCSYLQVVVLIFVLRRFMQKQALGHLLLDGLALTLLKTAAATLCMAAAAMASMQLMKQYHSIFQLLLTVPSAAAVYLLTAKWLHIKELSLLLGSKRTEKIAVKG